MPLKKLEKTNLVYLVYRRESPRDMHSLLRELQALGMPSGRSCEAVVDFSLCESMNHTEMQAIAGLLNSWRNTPNKLRLVINTSIARRSRALETMEGDNFVLYRNQETFVKELVRKGGRQIYAMV